MIIESIFGLSLALNVSLDTPPAADVPGRTAWLHLSVQQRDAALLPLVHRATDCIVRQVYADPRFRPDLHREAINDLIVDSVAGCGPAVRAMIRAHDRMYGSGSGEAFLLGPYLDVLPAAVVRPVTIEAR